MDDIGARLSSGSDMEEKPIETLLAVPLHYILRQTNSDDSNNPFLLSRIEASLLMQITTLSYELDALIQMSIQAIEKSYLCQQFSNDIQDSSPSMSFTNVYLLPIHCLLHQHGTVIPQQVIQHVQNHLERILRSAPSIVQQLKQCAEQNWSVSNALLHMTMEGKWGGCSTSASSGVGTLGKEKGLIAEMEEEVGRRLEGIVQICTNNLSTEGSLNGGGGAINLDLLGVMDCESMELFCDRLFGTVRDGSNADHQMTNDDGNLDSEQQQQQQQQQQGGDNNHRTDDKDTDLDMTNEKLDLSRTESVGAAALALGMLASDGADLKASDQNGDNEDSESEEENYQPFSL